MAGYSGTPLVKKLGIQEDHQVLLVEPPDDFEAALGTLPSGACLVREAEPRHQYPVLLLFVTSLADLKRQFPGLARRLTPAGGLWVAWPKRSSGVKTDLTEDVIRTVGLAANLVDNKVCAISEVWSGLRFVIRLKDRARGD